VLSIDVPSTLSDRVRSGNGDLMLGLDCGTQSSKAHLWTLSSEHVSAGSGALDFRTPHPDWAEQDSEEGWGSARTAIIGAVGRIDSSRIRALGVAFQRETFTLADGEGRPLRPGILWLGGRAKVELAAVTRGLGTEAYHRRTGKPLDVTSSISRMLWIQRNEQEVFSKAARWMDVGSFLLERLTGAFVTCVTEADTSGLIGLTTRAWDEELLAAAKMPRAWMPDLLEPGSVAGGLCPRAAAELGLPPGCL
jgi:xylulokinase